MKAIRSERITFRASREFRIALEKAAERDQRKLSDWIYLKLSALLAGQQSSQKVA